MTGCKRQAPNRVIYTLKAGIALTRRLRHGCGHSLKPGSRATMPTTPVRGASIRHDQNPVDLVFRTGRINARNTHAGHAPVQHVGVVRLRLTPAGKSLRQSMVAGRNVLDSGFEADVLTSEKCVKSAANLLACPVLRGHAPGLNFGNALQGRIQSYQRKSLVAPVDRDNIARGGGRNACARFRQ